MKRIAAFRPIIDRISLRRFFFYSFSRFAAKGACVYVRACACACVFVYSRDKKHLLIHFEDAREIVLFRILFRDRFDARVQFINWKQWKVTVKMAKMANLSDRLEFFLLFTDSRYRIYRHLRDFCEIYERTTHYSFLRTIFITLVFIFTFP